MVFSGSVTWNDNNFTVCKCEFILRQCQCLIQSVFNTSRVGLEVLDVRFRSTRSVSVSQACRQRGGRVERESTP